MIIVIFGLLSLITDNSHRVSALSIDNFHDGDWIPSIYINKTKPNGYTEYLQAHFIVRANDGAYVYCVEPWQELVDTVIYGGTSDNPASALNISREQWRRVSLIAYYGYGYGNHTDPKWYAISQVMIWRAIDPQSDVYFADRLNGNKLSNKFLNEINEIETLIYQHDIYPDFGVNKFDVNLKQSITLNDANSVLYKYDITSSDNITINSKTNNQLIITPNALGTLKLTLENSDKLLSTPPIVYADPYSQDIMVKGKYDPISMDLTFNVVGGKIRIKKVDSKTKTCTAQGQATLVGAKYNVIDSNNNVVSTLTIGNDCTATTDYLPIGSYKIKEVSQSTGYYLDDTTYTVDVNSSEIFDVTVQEDVIYGKIKIKKVDKDTNICNPSGKGSLYGAEYEVRDHNNQVVDTLIIGTDCSAISKDLPYGNYTVKETKPSKNYILDTNTYSVNINKNNTIEITSKEEIIKGRIKLLKVDSETKTCTAQGQATLVGAKYEILDSTNTVVDTLTIGTDCSATSKLLPINEYTIRESSSSTGYYLNTKIYNANVDSKNTVNITVEEEVKKGKIQIKKIDSETKTCTAQGQAMLVGAKYGIYDWNNHLVDTLTIDGNCSAISKLLPYGNYKVKELSSPTGYKLDEQIYNANILNSDTVTITSNEEVKKGRIQVKKVDSKTKTCTPQGQATLVGAKYGIYDWNNHLVDTLTIDGNCSAISNLLPYGNYKVKEIEATDGYYISTSIYSQFVAEELDYSITDEEDVVTNFISILKQYDYVDGNTTFLNAEANITFEIYYPTGELYDTIITDKNGYATIEIPYGVWKFHQVNTNTGFEKIYDFFITVDKDSEKEQYYNILNNKLSAYLQVIKVDSETGKTIALEDTTFKILNTDTNQYVSQFVGGKVYSEFKTDSDGKFITYLKLEAGNYKLIEVSNPNGYVINSNGIEFSIGDDTHYAYTTYGVVVTITYENQPIKGIIEITKKGEKVVIEDGTYKYEQIPLDNVKFEIYANEDILSADKNVVYYKKDQLVDTIVSNPYGIATSKPMPLGKYYLIEVNTKDNHVLNTEKYEFTLEQIDNRTPIVYHNYTMLNMLKKGTLEFTKTDLTTSEGIPNTEIAIFHMKEDGTSDLVFKGMTGLSGEITISNLFVGKFKIVETNPATSYILNDEPVFFEIKENGEIVKANMTNEKIVSKLIIHKVDENDNPIVGVKFGIFDLDNNLLDTLVTNEHGIAEIEKEYGSYYYQELEAVAGFVLNEEKIYFDVKEHNKTIESTIINEKITSKLIIHKVDENDNPIAGVKFGIFDLDNNLLDTLITNEQGIAEIEKEYGSYYYQELETLAGFVLNEEKIYFDVKEHNKTIESTIINEKITSKLIIHKVDENDNPIAGVKFGIFDLENNLLDTLITNEQGIAEIEKEYGSYYYQELETVAGFVLNNEKIYFDIKEHNKVIDSTIVNEKIISKLVIHKVDENNNPIAGVKFGIFDLENNLLDTLITNEYGIAEITKEYGSYYYQELETVAGFVLNDEKIYFDIKEHNKVIDSTIINEKVEMPKTYNTDTIPIIKCGILVILGIGLLFYAKKK